MTPDQAAAYINAQTALLLAELEAIKARNRCYAIEGGKVRELEGGYDPAYQALLDKYQHVLGHNGVISLFQDCSP